MERIHEFVTFTKKKKKGQYRTDFWCIFYFYFWRLLTKKNRRTFEDLLVWCCEWRDVTMTSRRDDGRRREGKDGRGEGVMKNDVICDNDDATRRCDVKKEEEVEEERNPDLPPPLYYFLLLLSSSYSFLLLFLLWAFFVQFLLFPNYMETLIIFWSPDRPVDEESIINIAHI